MSSRISRWAGRALWIWLFFCIHTLYLFQCVFMHQGFLYMYISLGLFLNAVSAVLLLVPCVMLAHFKSHQSTTQKTNQFVFPTTFGWFPCPALWLAAHTPSAPLALMPPPPSNTTPVNSVGRLQMQLNLHGLQQNATDLRKQLTQLRKIQVNNIYCIEIYILIIFFSTTIELVQQNSGLLLLTHADNLMNSEIQVVTVNVHIQSWNIFCFHKVILRGRTCISNDCCLQMEV